MDNIIPLRLIEGGKKGVYINGLSNDEKEWIEKFLIVFRNRDHMQKEAVLANIKAHYLNCLRKGSSK